MSDYQAFIALLIVSLSIWLLVSGQTVTKSIATVMLWAGLVFFSSLMALKFANTWTPLAIPVLIQLPLLLFCALLSHYRNTRQAKDSVAQALGRYVPQPVVRRLSENPESGKMSQDHIHAICFCSDIQDFTTFSESTTPSTLSAITNEYFQSWADCITRYDGEILNYLGDGATCIWRVTDSSRSAKLNAALAALAVLEHIERFRKRIGCDFFVTRIGLHYGEIVMGDAGSDVRYSYGITGDTVNTASRIEQLNKKLRTVLLASGDVVDDLDELLLRRTGDFLLKGKTQVLTMHEIVAEKSTATVEQSNLVLRFKEAMQSFDDLDWREAHQLFQKIEADYPHDGPSEYYRRLCAAYLDETNPAEPQRVIRLETK